MDLRNCNMLLALLGIFLVLVETGCNRLGSGSRQAWPTDSRQLRLQRAFDEVAQRHGIPGAALIVTDNQWDQPLVLSTGQADRERNLPVTPQTRFEFASAGKPFLALACLRGNLDLQANAAPVHVRREITLAHLLTHTSGVLLDPTVTHSEILFPAGVARIYSNSNYAWAAQHIEHVTHQPWDKWVRAQLLPPAALSGTTQAVGYSRDGQRIEHPGTEIPPGAGGLTMSAGELAMVLHSLVREPELEDLLLAPEALAPCAAPVAYGWETLVDSDGTVRGLRQAGNAEGVGNLVQLDFQEDHAVALLTNQRYTADFFDEVLTLLGEEFEVPWRILRQQTVPPVSQDQIVGSYALWGEDEIAFSILERDGGLVLQQNTRTTPLYPISPDRFLLTPTLPSPPIVLILSQDPDMVLQVLPCGSEAIVGVLWGRKAYERRGN